MWLERAWLSGRQIAYSPFWPETGRGERGAARLDTARPSSGAAEWHRWRQERRTGWEEKKEDGDGPGARKPVRIGTSKAQDTFLLRPTIVSRVWYSVVECWIYSDMNISKD